MDVLRSGVAVVAVFAAAFLCGWVARRLGQPAVLGELVGGFLLGPTLLGARLHLPGIATEDAEPLRIAAELGAIILLLAVGLETDLRGMLRVGRSSINVALVGIVASFVVGYALSWSTAKLWAPWTAASDNLPPYLLHALVGAALTATSVGITARVLKDLGTAGSPESRIILGAAVLDDIGGLLILSGITVAVGAVGDSDALATTLGIVALKAVSFLAAGLGVGFFVLRPAVQWLHARQVPLAATVATIGIALAYAWASHWAGLATIVGAFLAGLVLSGTPATHAMQPQMRIVAWTTVPFFFAALGMRIDLGAMQGHTAAVLALAGILSAGAIAAKLACGLGVVQRQADRLIVGIGMVPRGEVGLLFASLGLASGLLATWQYAVLVLVAFLTTLVTPPWLKSVRGRFTADPAA